MRKYLLLSCQKASELIEKKQLVGLNAWEASRLAVHLRMCKACMHYKAESELINYWLEQGKRVPERAEAPAAQLSPEEKAAMASQLAAKISEEE